MRTIYHFLVTFLLVSTTQLFGQAVPSYVPTNGLVGWWGFNGNAQDGSGNGNHGTVNGATLTTDRFGNQNGAYDFDGVDDFIQTNFLGTYVNGFAVSVWINTAFNFSSYEHKGIVYSRTNMSRGLGLTMQDTIQSSGLDFSLTLNQNGSLSYGTGSRILPNDGNWHLLVGTFMQSNNQQIYSLFMDGVQISTNSHLNSNPFVLQTPFLFGRDDLNGFGNRNWNGKLDDIGIWNRALSQQEITNLYNSQLPPQTSLCLPTITTTSASSVGVDSVVIGGNITNDGGSSIVLRGVCYSISPNPNMGNSRTEDGSGTGSFNTVLRGLTSSTVYYARSYAKNSNGVVVYGNEVSFTTTSSITIGSNYAGGIVFYLDSTGQHGLVCAPSDSGTYWWGCHNVLIGTSVNFGAGNSNTNLILSGCGQRPIAASVCDDLVLNGYSDWYLPSKNELQLMYSNLHQNGLGNFSWGFYWTSSEETPANAWAMIIHWGAWDNLTKLNHVSHRVRAIRSF